MTLSIEPHTSFEALEAYLNQCFVEKEEIIRLALLNYIIQENMLILGPPGTAKSDIISSLTAALDKQFFLWAMSETTTPEELFGPYSLPELKNGRYVRITDGKLPGCEVAFLDEIGKSNSVIQNTLLRPMNERYFNDGTGDKPIPLEALYSASNEMLEEPKQQAFFDRYLLRCFSNPVSDSGFVRMIKTINTGRGTSPSISAAEVAEIRGIARNVTIDADLINTLHTLRRRVTNAGISVSDRRWGKCLKVLKGAAALSNRNKAEEADFFPLQFVLPTLPEDFATVKAIILEFTFPFLTKALKIKDEAGKAFDKFEQDLASETDPDKQTALYISVAKKLENALKKLNDLDGKSHPEFVSIYNNIKAKREEILASVIGTI